MVAARGIGAEIAAAMRGDDLQSGKAIERAFEDQVLQGDRGVERIADRVRQPAIALETLGKFRRALRMDEQDRAELFGLGPDRMEFGVGKILSQHAAADRGAAQALLLDRGLQLLHREVGKLQRQRGEGPEPIRPRCAQFGQLLVLHLDDLRPPYRGPCRTRTD